MANGIRTGDPRGFNKGCSSNFRLGSRVQQTTEEGRRIYRPKRYGNNNKDEDNSPKTPNDKKNPEKYAHDVMVSKLNLQAIISEFDYLILPVFCQI